MGSEEGDNVASVLVCFGEVHSEIKRDAMLHTLHLSNKKGETSRALSKDRASLFKKSTDHFRCACVGCFIHGRGRSAHTMQAHGAGTAGLERGSTCLQYKPPVGIRSSRHRLRRLNPTISRIYL